jgi:sporulation protein YlmC with PRC-barrel domain
MFGITKLLASTALGLCLICAPALAQTQGVQTQAPQSQSGQTSSGTPSRAGARPGYWAGLAAANRNGDAGPAVWAALVAAANSAGQANPDFWTALATAASRDNCADPSCWAAVAAAKGDKTGLTEARLFDNEQKLTQVEHALSDLRRAKSEDAKSGSDGLPQAAHDSIDQALAATRDALHHIRDSIEALDQGGGKSGGAGKAESSGSSSSNKSGQNQQSSASTNETGSSGNASTGTSTAMSGNKPGYLMLGNAEKNEQQKGASQSGQWQSGQSQSGQSQSGQSQSGSSQAEQSQASQSQAEQRSSGTVWTFVAPDEASATRQGTGWIVVTPKGGDSSKSASQAGSGTAEQQSDKSEAKQSKADKGDTKSGQLESFASDRKSPRPYTGKPDENTVSANRMIAKKLYTTDGSVFGQVVDILLDSDSGRMKGVVVMRTGQSGKGQPSGSANHLVVVPVADLKLTDGKWLITDLSHAG